MNPNLTVYDWAEQANRQRLSNAAARGWLVDEAAGHSAHHAAWLRRAAGTLLVRVGTYLQGAGAVSPLAAPNGSLARA
ncbi:MAG: hypothetical protein H0T75_09785 [Rhizobiales bacterium]|nr:hypothetical protein [Hyphomicrobiales bacterium]